MQEDSANDLKMLQEWFETNRIRETGIVENVQKQPASPERDEMLEICKGNIEEFTMMIQLVASIIEREKNYDHPYVKLSDHIFTCHSQNLIDFSKSNHLQLLTNQHY